MLESIFLQLESIGLQHLLEPIIDTQWFGCPDDCIIQGGEYHELLNFLLSPILYVIIGIAVGVGLLVKFARRSRRIKKEKKISYAEKIKEFDRDNVGILKMPKMKSVQDNKQEKRLEKKKYLEQITHEPQKAYLDWVTSLDPEHPQTANIKAVHTETKEIVSPEQKILEQQVEKMMKEEHLSEDKATDKIIEQMKIPQEASRIVEKPSGEIIDVFTEQYDKDIFKQDITPKKYPKRLLAIQKKLKLQKKESGKTKFVLTDLGKLRRDQYAEQIENNILKWTFPLPEYLGKNKVYQKTDDEIKLGVKKLALFCSMAEFMIDKKRKKKRYWREIPIGE